MKTSCLKYALLVFSVGFFCAETQALSQKSKAIIKSGTLGTLSTALTLGASWFITQQIQSICNMNRIYYTTYESDKENMVQATAFNSVAAGLLAGYVATKSAYNAFKYFKQMKALKNQNFSGADQATVQFIQ